MKFQIRSQIVLIPTVVGLLVLASWSSATAQQFIPPPNDGSNQEPEALTRGPVHEAFATQFNVNPTPGITVPHQPPGPINEALPSMAPNMPGVQWVPGYWGWDDDRDTFIWISGTLRVSPPGRRWIPGYWTPTSNGFQWVGGLWIPQEAQDLDYVPCPPETPEEAVGAAPGEDYFWVPAAWIFTEGEYRRRPGYWVPVNSDWVWSPDHYRWSPNGCLFVSGFWDHPLNRRGVLFSPIYFPTPVYQQPTYVYTPTIVVDVVPLMINFWIRPNYCHYYFGDYYGPQYAGWGIQPWFFAYRQPRYYDPLLTYYALRGGPNFIPRLQGWNQFYLQNPQQRPPRTFRAQTQFASLNRGDAQARQSLLGQSLVDFAARSDGPARFERLGDERRQNWDQTSRQLRDLQHQRSQLEGAARKNAPDRGDTKDVPRDARLPREKLKLPELTPAQREPQFDRSPRDPGSMKAVPKTRQELPPPGTPPAEKKAEKNIPEKAKKDRIVPTPPQPGIPPTPGTPPAGKQEKSKRETPPGKVSPDVGPQIPKVEPTVPQPTPKAEKPDRPERPQPAPGPQPQPQPQPPVVPKVEKPAPSPVVPKVEKPAPAIPKAEIPQPQPQPPVVPKVERPNPAPVVPKVERPSPQPAPKVERPQPAPKAERPQPQPQPPVVPKVERPNPAPVVPKVERPSPQPAPKVERPQPAPKADRPPPAERPKKEKGKKD